MQTRKPYARQLAWSLFVLLLAPAQTSSGQKPKEWNPTIVPSQFSSTVDNQYFPLIPGQRLRYASKSGDETLVVEVTSQTKMVMGVRTTVVTETVAENGQTVEISQNWFAQDRDGNVWYFGEFSQDFQNGVPVSTEGSWEAGVNGAKPGIIMKAQPQRGETYFQEYAPGVAEDMATVQSVGITQGTQLRTFSGVVKTKEWTPLESSSVEHKYYAPGVGLIREEKGGDWLELVATN